ncbi:MAG TPA: hypothetical protein VNT26_13245 [Candidatus Sulfotelmatobacter sp.]|nr:hypothetical protein [Candidatus Sulfotelmatobacter sp.]HWI58679.1 hypothetical protein [Bacillota bacterium]
MDNATEHSFPLPEFETHKLDELKEQITHPPSTRNPAGFLQTNPWTAVTMAVAGGFLAGIWLKTRAS